MVPGKKEKKARIRGVLEKIKKGEKSFVNEDLSKISLKNLSLKGVNFSGCDLSYANLKKADLSQANLEKVSLKEANLAKANLSQASLKNSDLEKTELSNANLKEADLSGVNLQGAILCNCNLEGANLENGVLKQAVLNEAICKKAIFKKADLSLVDAMDANFQEADLAKADLKNAIFSYADFSKANLKETVLDGADLTFAELKAANFKEAKIKKTNFKGAYGLSEEEELDLKVRGAIVSKHYLKKFFKFLWVNKIARIGTVLIIAAVAVYVYLYLKDPYNRSSDYISKLADRYHQEGDINRALVLYEIIAERDDFYASTAALSSMAMICRDKRDLEKSTELFKKALSLAEENLMDTSQISQLEIEISDNILEAQGTLKAVQYLEERKRFYEGEEDIEDRLSIKIAEIYEANNNYEDAELIYAKVVNKKDWMDYSLQRDAVINLARVYSKNRQYEKAEEMYKRVIEIVRENNKNNNSNEGIEWIVSDLVELYKRTASVPRGIEFIEGLIKEYEQEEEMKSQLKLELGKLYEYIDKTAEASQVLESISEAKDPQVFLSLARINRRGRNVKEAEKNFKQAIKIADNNQLSYIYEELANLYIDEGEIEEAIATLKDAVSDVEFKLNPLLSLGRTYHRLGRIEEAEQVFQEIIEKYKEHSDAYLEIGRIARDRKNYAKAEEYFEKAVDRATDKNQLQWMLQEKIWLYKNKGETEKAIKLIKDNIAEYKGDSNIVVDSLLNLGRIYMENGETAQAEGFFREILKKYGNSERLVETNVELGRVERSRKNYVKAEEYFDKAIGLTYQKEQLSWILQDKIQLYKEKGEIEEVIRILKENIEKFKGRPEIEVYSLLELGRAYREGGKLEKAQHVLAEVLEKYSNDARVIEAYMELGRVERSKKNYVKAEEYFDKAINLTKEKEQLSWMFQDKVQLYKEMGKGKEVIELLKNNLERFKGDVNVVVDSSIELGRMYAEGGSLKEAEKLFIEVVEKYGDTERITDVYMELGRLEKKNRDYAKADEYFDLAINKARDKNQLTWMFQEKVQLYKDMGENKKVIELLKNNLERFKGDVNVVVDTLIELGRVYSERGSLKEAKKIFSELVEKYKGNNRVPEVYIELGRLNRNEKNYAKAEEYFEKAISLTNERGQLSWMWQERVQLCREQGDKQKAIELLKENVERFAEDAEVVVDNLIEMGRLYSEDAKFKEAQEIFIEIIDKYGDNQRVAEVYIELGRLEKSRADYARAAEYFDRAVEDIKGRGDGSQLLAVVQEKIQLYRDLGDRKKAIELLKANLEKLTKREDGGGVLNDLIELGRLYVEEGEAKEAEKIFKEAVEKYSESERVLEIYMELGSLEKNNRNYTKAEEYFAKAIGRTTDKSQLQWMLQEKIQLYREIGERDKVIGLLRDNLERFKGDTAIVINNLLELGRMYMAEGQIEEAEKVYHQVINTYGDNERVAEAYMELGRLKRSGKNYTKAEEYFTKAIEKVSSIGKNDQLLWLWQEKVQLYKETGDREKAIELLKGNIEKFKDDVDIVVDSSIELGRVYSEAGSLKEAQDIFTEVIEKYATNKRVASAYLEMGRLERNKGDYAKAEEYFDLAVEKTKDRNQLSWILQEKVQLLRQMGDKERAEKLIRENMDKFADNEDIVISNSLDLGRMYKEAGELEEAERIFRETVEKYGTNMRIGEVYIELGRLEKSRQNYAKAEEYFDLAITEITDNNQLSWMLQDKIQLYRESGDTQKAKELIKSNLERFRGQEDISVNYLIDLGQIYKAEGELEEADKVYREIIETYSDNARVTEVYMELGRLEKSKKNYAKAEEYFDLAIDRTTDNNQLSWMWQEKVQLYKETGNREKAVALLKNNLEKFKEDKNIVVNSLIDLGRVYSESGKFKEAQKAFQKVIDKHGNNQRAGEVYAELGRLKRNERNYAKAEEYFDLAIERTKDKSQLSWILQEKIQLYRDKGDRKKAIELVKSNIKRFAGDKEVVINNLIGLGRMYAAGGELKEAEKVYQEVLEKHSDDSRVADVYMELGRLKRNESNYAKAEEYFDLAIERTTDKNQLSWMRQEKVQLYRDKGDRKKAIELLKQSINEFGGNKDIEMNGLFDLGRMYVEEGNAEEAEKIFKEAVGKYANNPRIGEAYIELGRIERKRKVYAKAEEYYNLAIEKTIDRNQLSWMWQEKAQFYREAGDESKAISLIKESIEKFKDYNDISINNLIDLAGIYVEQAELDKAEKLYKQVVESYSAGARLSEVYIGLMNTAQRKNNYERAEDSLNKALESAQNEGQVTWTQQEANRFYRGAGEYFKNSNDRVKAIKYYQKALQFTDTTEQKNQLLQEIKRLEGIKENDTRDNQENDAQSLSNA